MVGMHAGGSHLENSEVKEVCFPASRLYGDVEDFGGPWGTLSAHALSQGGRFGARDKGWEECWLGSPAGTSHARTACRGTRSASPSGSWEPKSVKRDLKSRGQTLIIKQG